MRNTTIARIIGAIDTTKVYYSSLPNRIVIVDIVIVSSLLDTIIYLFKYNIYERLALDRSIEVFIVIIIIYYNTIRSSTNYRLEK